MPDNNVSDVSNLNLAEGSSSVNAAGRDQFLSLDAAVKLLTNFSGDSKESVTEWIDNCEIILNSVRQVDSHMLFQIIKTKVSGKARNFIKYRNFQNWDFFKEHLEELFAEKRTLSHWQLELNSTKQSKGENLDTYSNKIEKCLSNLLDVATVNKTQEEAVTISELLRLQALNVFVTGLQEPLKMHVKSRDPKTLESAVELARIEERELLSNRDSQNYFGYKVNSNQRTVQGNCFVCKKSGHSASNCFYKNNSVKTNDSRVQNFVSVKKPQVFSMQSQPICFYCKKPNHRIADCRKRIFNERLKATQNDNPHSINRNSGNEKNSSTRGQLEK
ncbi:uncharacterized protein LOC116182576 [Photinus pyralis]|nr:uncharacterized protein LOC116182576 [Photinus pyralis]